MRLGHEASETGPSAQDAARIPDDEKRRHRHEVLGDGTRRAHDEVALPALHQEEETDGNKHSREYPERDLHGGQRKGDGTPLLPMETLSKRVFRGHGASHPRQTTAPDGAAADVDARHHASIG